MHKKIVLRSFQDAKAAVLHEIMKRLRITPPTLSEDVGKAKNYLYRFLAVNPETGRRYQDDLSEKIWIKICEVLSQKYGEEVRLSDIIRLAEEKKTPQFTSLAASN